MADEVVLSEETNEVLDQQTKNITKVLNNMNNTIQKFQSISRDTLGKTPTTRGSKTDEDCVSTEGTEPTKNPVYNLSTQISRSKKTLQ